MDPNRKKTTEQKSFRKCAYCRREFFDGALRICPKSGLLTCRYCCKSCPESYIAPVGDGCRAVDEKIKAKRQLAEEQKRKRR